MSQASDRKNFFGEIQKPTPPSKKVLRSCPLRRDLPGKMLGACRGRNFDFWPCFFYIDANLDLDGDFLPDGEIIDFSAW